MIEAILDTWPGAQVVVRGGVLERWEGPIPEPTPREIADAVAAYDAKRPEVAADKAMRTPIVQAMLTAFAPALGKTPAEMRAALKAELIRQAG